jgi:CheY-like chemotaxis protein
VAKTGEMGIHACQPPGSRRPDSVIVDLHLSDMIGLDVLKRLKDDAGDVQYPVVLFSDSGEECKAATAVLRAGVHDYIAKSWLTADGPACAVENAIERFKLRERLKQKRVALERQNREFRALVESVPTMITFCMHKYAKTYIAPAIERATGLPLEWFLGKTSRGAGLPTTIFIAISDPDPDTCAPHPRKARFDHYLVKPVDLDVLLGFSPSRAHKAVPP